MPFCSCSVVQCIECGSRFDPFCSIPSIYKQEKFAWVKSPCSWSLLWFCLLLLLPHPSKTTTITLLSFIPTTYIWFGVSVIQAIQSSYIYPQLLVQWLVFCLCNYSTSDIQTKLRDYDQVLTAGFSIIHTNMATPQADWCFHIAWVESRDKCQN